MTPEQQQRSDRAHDVLDAAARAIEELGFQAEAAWRMMAWCAFDEIVKRSCPDCANADLLRLRTMLDKHLASLANEAVTQ